MLWMLGFESVLEDSQGMYYLDVWNHKESLFVIWLLKWKFWGNFDLF